MTTILLDTHVVVWWSSDRSLVSAAASSAIDTADELIVADVSWWELAWLAHRGRILLDQPPVTWLHGLAEQVRSVPVTPSIAATAASLPRSFPGDPVDRLIYATAIETGSLLVTKDERLRTHPHPIPITIW